MNPSSAPAYTSWCGGRPSPPTPGQVAEKNSSLRLDRLAKGEVFWSFLPFPLSLSIAACMTGFPTRIHRVQLCAVRPLAMPFLALLWTLMHVIDESSPLFRGTAESLVAEGSSGSSLLVSITGYDESISATVTARRNYVAKTLLFGHDFIEIIDQLPAGELMLDLTHFHDTVPVASTIT
jgi:hypothetical protein